MKLGLIADPHADFDALQMALSRLKQTGVDSIICAGDLVEKGPNGDAVVEFLQSEKIICVAGNHDHDAIDKPILASKTIDSLKTLPDTRLLTFGEKNILVAHGSPWSNLVYLFPNSERHVFKRVAREAQQANADIVVLGHTHLPLIAQVGNVLIVNPGSVCGTHASGSRTYGILHLPEGLFEVFSLTTNQPVDVAKVQLTR